MAFTNPKLEIDWNTTEDLEETIGVKVKDTIVIMNRIWFVC